MKMLLALALSIMAGLATASGSREDIEIAFDRNKGQLYAEYGRALREHPGLHGKIVLRVDIARTGAVTGCRVQSSEMGDSDLPQKLCARILTWKFEPRSSPITITKPIDFFPGA